MNDRVRELWRQALLSGEYQQGQRCLRSDQGYCCLGVLCDIARKEGIGHWETADGLSYLFRSTSQPSLAQLPKSVREWAGILEDEHHLEHYFINLNDSYGKSFSEIAEVLQSGSSLEEAVREYWFPSTE